MRKLFVALTLVCVAAFAQSSRTPPSRRPPGMTRIGSPGASAAEAAVKQSMEQLVQLKKAFERDLEIMSHLRTADQALVDNMQPTVSVQKAYEEVEAAKGLQPEVFVLNGIIKVERELEGARRSPTSADFGRLRAVLRDEALGPQSRVLARNAARLQEETVAWLRVQELIGAHVRVMSEIVGDALRAAER